MKLAIVSDSHDRADALGQAATPDAAAVLRAMSADPDPRVEEAALAASGEHGLRRVAAWVERQPDSAYRPIDGLAQGPAVPDPGAIYAVGLNYGPPDGPDPERPARPPVHAKLPTPVARHGATVSWDRPRTASGCAEVGRGT